MRGGTLFSGIGAPEVAAPFMDWRWSADIDDFANAVRAHHWPGIPNLGDVSKLNGDEIEPVDVLVFGSPCQSFSVAGKRLGLDDPRGNLALVALALVQRIRPRWFVFENVPGLFSSAGGDDFAAFLRAVRECGYSGAWRVLDAQYFGVPQRRRRIFFVGHPGDDWRPPAEILLEPESLSGNPPPGREARKDVAPTISARPSDGGGLGTDFDPDGGLIASTGDTAHCLNAGGMGRQDYETETLVAFTSKDHGADAGELSPTLRAMGHGESHPNGGGQIAVAITGDRTHALNSANNGKMSSEDGTGRGVPIVGGGTMVRRLTPVECERLQGFPDNFTNVPWRGKTDSPDGRRYKALGNSMAVPVMRWILERLVAVDGH